MAAGPGTNGDATRLLSWKPPCTPLLAVESNSVDATPAASTCQRFFCSFCARPDWKSPTMICPHCRVEWFDSRRTVAPQPAGSKVIAPIDSLTAGEVSATPSMHRLGRAQWLNSQVLAVDRQPIEREEVTQARGTSGCRSSSSRPDRGTRRPRGSRRVKGSRDVASRRARGREAQTERTRDQLDGHGSTSRTVS
jgi:hypothetical protein